MAVAVLLSGVAASTASAFFGEGDVLNPGKTDLTGPAKTIIEKPTFLPDTVAEAGASGGATEAGAAAGVFETAGVLPALGAGVLALGAGAGVGSVICHVIGIEGCWLFDSEGSQTAEVSGGFPAGGYWIFKEGALFGGPAWSYYWEFGTKTSNAYKRSVTGYNVGECEVWSAPPNATSHFKADTSSFVCEGPEGEHVEGDQTAFVKSPLDGRGLSHITDAEAEAGGYSVVEHEAPSDWSEKAASALTGREGDPSARVGEKVASEIEGSGVSDPYATYVSVPGCSGEAWIECKADLEELELVPERSELGWETADVELEPDAVTELAPAPATEVETGSKVVVTTNPPEEGMPLLVPEPEVGETYDHYIERLAPGLEPSRQNVSDANADPSAGANAVLETDPSAGSRLPPSGGDVDVYTNPPYLAPGGGGGGCEASIGSVDFSPLNQPVGTRFPFGVIAFFVGWVEEWSGEGFEDPSFTFTVIPEGLFGAENAAEVTLDLETVEPAMELVRIAFLLVSFVGLLWFLGTAAMKVQGDAS